MNCPKCGSANPDEFAFCGRCGTQLNAAAPAPLSGEQNLPRAERRQLAVMFCDLAGSTPLAERLDPEVLGQVLHQYETVCTEAVARFGGHIARSFGDGLLIYFGYPLAHEDDARRAVRAALQVLSDMRRLNEQLRPAKDIELAVRIGLDIGWVVVGERSGSDWHESLGVGLTLHLAARLQSIAQSNTVLISAATYQLVHGEFECQRLGTRRLKGISEPVEVYRVLDVGSDSKRTAGQGLYSPLVGRDQELQSFTHCLERLSAGQGGILSILAEAGLGKSRLVAEAKAALVRDSEPSQGWLWLEGRALSFGQTISYWPFQEIIREAAGIAENDSEETAWTKLEKQVTALFPNQVAEVLPYLASVLALPVRRFEERVKYLDGEGMRRQIFFTARRFFERLAQAQPLALVFEDLHWVDQSSADLLEHLLPLVERVPFLVCGVGRPDSQTPAVRLRELAARDYADRHTEITLEPLSPTDSTQLMCNLLEIDDLSPPVRDMILRKAEGNPFFVEEVIRAMIALGGIVRDSTTGHWHASALAEHITIPDTIQGVIMARVDRLDEEVKQALRLASVIGRTFFYRVLRAIDEADRELDRHLGELQHIELILEKSRVPELEYIFKHALTQEATYESILLQRRRELHAQVGCCIERLFGDRLEEFYSVLAYHYARAEDWEKAQVYLFKAGDQASRLAADAEALAHYERAMAAYTRVFGDHWDPLQRAALELKLGEAFYRRGEHAQALEYLQRTLEHLGHPFPTSRWRVRWAIAGQLLEQFGHQLLPAIFGRRPAWLTNSFLEVAGPAGESLTWIDVWINQERAVLDVLWALNLSDRQDSLYWKALAYSGAGYTCTVLGLHRLARFYSQRAVAMAEQVQHPGAISLAYHLMANHEFHLAQWKPAVEHLQRATETYQAIGDLQGWGAATTLLTKAQFHQGNSARALELCQKIIQVGRDGGDSHVLACGLQMRGMVQRRAGLLDDAVECLQRAIGLYRAVPDYMHVAMAGGDLGQCYLRQGKLQQAVTMLEESCQLIAERGLHGLYLTPPLNGLAEAYVLAAEQAQETERADWLKKARPACQAALKQGKANRGGLPEAMRLQGRYEWLNSKPESAQKWWQRSLVLAQELKERYELGLTHLEMGQRLGECAHVEQAEKILGQVGACLDLAHARELLGLTGKSPNSF